MPRSSGGVLEKIAREVAPMPRACADPRDAVAVTEPVRASRIAGTRPLSAGEVLTNEALARRVDTSDEWIRTRTGIRQRHIAAQHETTSDLALHASREAIAAAGMTPADIDLIIVATADADMIFPSTACILQDKLGITAAPRSTCAAVCSRLRLRARVRRQDGRPAAPRATRWSSAPRSTRASSTGTTAAPACCSATARARSWWCPRAAPGILTSHLHADGSHREILCVPGTVHNGAVTGTPFLRMDGTAVFKFAVKVLADFANEALSPSTCWPRTSTG